MRNYWAREGWLRLRLVGLIALAVVPLSSVVFIDLELGRKDNYQDIEREASVAAQVLAVGHKKSTESTEAILSIMSELDSVRGESVEDCIQTMRAVNATLSELTNLGIIDLDGFIRCAAQLPENLTYAGDRDYFLEAMDSGGFSRGSYQIGRITGLPAINFGYPVFDDSGELRGVLYAALGLQPLLDELETTMADAEVLIVSASGNVILASAGTGIGVGEIYGDPQLPAIISQSVTGTTELVWGEERHIVGHAMLSSDPGTEVVVLVGLPVRVAEAEVNSVFIGNVILLLLSLVVTVVAAWALAERTIVSSQRRIARERVERIKDLQRQDERRIQLVNNIGHDLSSPMTPIQLHLHILKQKPLDEKTQKSIDVIERNMAQIKRLVADLRDVFKMEAGRLQMTQSPVDVAALLHSAVESLSPQAQDRSITLVERVEQNHVVTADEDRMYQVILNFMTNAIKFSPEQSTIEVGLDELDGGIRLAVKDHGRGLDEGEMKRLFQPFTQVHDPSEVQEKGTGLGLFICRGIIEAHGGRIGVESEGHGTGSEFWFWVPTTPQQSSE